jgi:hypothetical protein
VNQDYDMCYGDFQRYAETKLGFNPRDPNNPNNVNGYSNYDMGLSEVRRPTPSYNGISLAYVNPVEGYQDRQGNYYDMSGKPMAPPSWASETPPNRGIGGLFGGGQNTGKFAPGVAPENNQPYDMPNMQDDRGFGGPGSMGYGVGPIDQFGGPYTPRPDLGPNVGFGVGLPQPGMGGGYGEMNNGAPSSFVNQFDPGGFPGMDGPNFGSNFGEPTPNNPSFLNRSQVFNQRGRLGNQTKPAMQDAFNPQSNFGGGGFMGGGSGSLFGGGGFAGK